MRFSKLVPTLSVVVASLGLFWASFHYADTGAAWLKQQHIELAHPEYLWAALVIPWLWLVRIHTLSDLPLLQQLVGTSVRSAIVLAIVFALTEPYTSMDQSVPISTAILVDVSDSVSDESLAAAQQYIKDVWAHKGETDVSIITFASRPVVLPPTDTITDAPQIARHPNEGSNTDIQSALRLSYGVLPDKSDKRIVLISDGNETRGNLANEAASAASFDISLYSYDALGDRVAGELLIRSVEISPDVKPRVPFSVTATVEANQNIAAQCVLSINGEQTHDQDVELESGKQPVRFENVTVPKGGEKNLEVVCRPKRPEDDRFESNNRYKAIVMVPEKPRVLYVEGNPKQTRDLYAALAGEFDVEVRGPSGVPGSSGQWSMFDAVIVSDVPQKGRLHYENFSYSQMEAVRNYVSKGGIFIMAGGEKSFGPGGYTGSLLEREVLPVTLEAERNNDIPGLALVLVLDKSGSMSGTKMELAKDAAKATVSVLQPDDLLGVIAFDARFDTAVSLERAANFYRIQSKLSRLTAGGGTSIYPALEAAFEQLVEVDAQLKHVILLTDGQASSEGILDLARRMMAAKITVTTVAVGDDADSGLLANVATIASGRFYRTRDPRNIPKIFMKETVELGKQTVIEDRFQPRLSPRFARLQMFRGLGNLPPLDGYVSTKAKPRAEVLLSSHKGEPILARMRLGTGWSYAWTSDVKAKWAYSWVNWAGYPKFWRQLIRGSMPFDQELLFPMAMRIERGVLVAELDAVATDDRFLNGLHVRSVLTQPDGTETPVTLQQEASGRYEARVPVDDFGLYTLSAELFHQDTEGAVGKAEAFVTNPYPEEHALALRHNHLSIQTAVMLTNGKSNPTFAELFAPSPQKTSTIIPRWQDLLYLALGLFVLDVLLRRVRFWKMGKP